MQIKLKLLFPQAFSSQAGFKMNAVQGVVVPVWFVYLGLDSGVILADEHGVPADYIPVLPPQVCGSTS